MSAWDNLCSVEKYGCGWGRPPQCRVEPGRGGAGRAASPVSNECCITLCLTNEMIGCVAAYPVYVPRAVAVSLGPTQTVDHRVHAPRRDGLTAVGDVLVTGIK